LIVSDNGKGLDQTANDSSKDSFGIKIIKAFAGKGHGINNCPFWTDPLLPSFL